MYALRSHTQEYSHPHVEDSLESSLDNQELHITFTAENKGLRTDYLFWYQDNEQEDTIIIHASVFFFFFPCFFFQYGWLDLGISKYCYLQFTSLYTGNVFVAHQR